MRKEEFLGRKNCASHECERCQDESRFRVVSHRFKKNAVKIGIDASVLSKVLTDQLTTLTTETNGRKPRLRMRPINGENRYFFRSHRFDDESPIKMMNEIASEERSIRRSVLK